MVGRVAEAVFKAGAHLGRRREADGAVLRREAVAVVVEPGDRLTVGVDALRGGRLDDVAHGVERRGRIGVDPAEEVGRGRCGGEAPGAEPHAGLDGRRVVRDVGAAHVERAEKLRREETAPDAVSRLGEELLDERCNVQEGVVVVHREEPLGRQQVRGAALLLVLVAVDREEAHGRVAGPAVADHRGGQLRRILHAERVEHPPCGILGPLRPAVADFERVPLVGDGQHPDRPGQQPGPVGRQDGRVPLHVEAGFGAQVAGAAEDGVVARCRGDRDLQRAPLARLVRIGERRGPESRDADPVRAEVAAEGVDRQFHGIRFLRLGRISSSSVLIVP